MIRAGKLDQSIRIQSVATAQDGMGATAETWSDLSGAPCRAEYIPLRGTERIEAGKLEMKTEFKLRVRRDVRIDSSCRVTHGGKTYRITGVEDYQRAGDMVLHCAEVL